MRSEQSTQPRVENPSSQQKKDVAKQSSPAESGSNWQFKILVMIIGFGVLMLILKAVGIVQ